MVKHGGYVWVCLNMWKPRNPSANHDFHHPIWSCYAYTGIYTPFSDRRKFTSYNACIYIYIQLKILMCVLSSVYKGTWKGKNCALLTCCLMKLAPTCLLAWKVSLPHVVYLWLCYILYIICFSLTISTYSLAASGSGKVLSFFNSLSTPTSDDSQE